MKNNIGNGILSLFLGGVIGILGTRLYLDHKTLDKMLDNTSKIHNHNPQFELVKMGVTTIEDYRSTGEHPYDIDGDGIKDTFCVHADGKFEFWPGKPPVSQYTDEPIENGYGPLTRLGNVGQGSSEYVNKARTNDKGIVEILVPFENERNSWVDIWEVRRKEN